jgi:uncharacterized protein YbjT (DUF2867 family)
MKIVVTTPTGNIGRKLVKKLIQAGIKPTVIARDPTRLEADVLPHVIAVVGDQRDAATLDQAFAGADAVFWLSPPDYTAANPTENYHSYGKAAAAALSRNSVRRLVHLSSSGAGGNLGFGLIDGLTLNEQTFNELDIDLVHLRPGFFYENFLFQLDPLRQGQYYSSFDPNVVTPFVATADIAEVAALRLVNLDWNGKSEQPILGAEELTTAQAVERVSEGIGRPIQYVRIPSQAVVESFAATGATIEVAEAYAKMLESLSSDPRPQPAHTAATTNPTRLAAWSFENLRPLLS